MTIEELLDAFERAVRYDEGTGGNNTAESNAAKDALLAEYAAQRVYAVELQGVVKAAEVILGLWSETELDPEDEEYEVWMAAFNESVTAFLADARAARTKQQFE